MCLGNLWLISLCGIGFKGKPGIGADRVRHSKRPSKKESEVGAKAGEGESGKE